MSQRYLPIILTMRASYTYTPVVLWFGLINHEGVSAAGDDAACKRAGRISGVLYWVYNRYPYKEGVMCDGLEQINNFYFQIAWCRFSDMEFLIYYHNIFISRHCIETYYNEPSRRQYKMGDPIGFLRCVVVSTRFNKGVWRIDSIANGTVGYQ